MTTRAILPANFQKDSTSSCCLQWCGPCSEGGSQEFFIPRPLTTPLLMGLTLGLPPAEEMRGGGSTQEGRVGEAARGRAGWAGLSPRAHPGANSPHLRRPPALSGSVQSPGCSSAQDGRREVTQDRRQTRAGPLLSPDAPTEPAVGEPCRAIPETPLCVLPRPCPPGSAGPSRARP